MTRKRKAIVFVLYLAAIAIIAGPSFGCGTSKDQVEGVSKGSPKTAGWKFPHEGLIAIQSNGMLVYDLGDGYKGAYVPTRKRGHTVTVGVPSSVYQQAKEAAAGEEMISRLIAWEALKRAQHPLHEDLLKDYVGSKRKGNFYVHSFRLAGGGTASAMVEIENNALVNGSAVRIWKDPFLKAEV